MFFDIKNRLSCVKFNLSSKESNNNGHNTVQDFNDINEIHSTRYPCNYRLTWVALALILLIILAEWTGVLYQSICEEQKRMLSGAEKRHCSIIGTVIESKKGQSYFFAETDEGTNVYVTLPYDSSSITAQHSDIWYPSGSKLYIQGELSLPDGARNPGGFDEAAWLRSKQTGLVLKGEKIQLIAEPDGVWRIVYKLHEYVEQLLHQGLKEEQVSLAMALLTGAKHYLDDTFYNISQQMGIAHIFAVSGLHVDVIGTVILFFFQQWGLARSWFGFILLTICLLIYCMLAGLPASAIRAAGMILLSALAMRLYRPIESINFLAFAAIVLLLDNPFLLWSAGFQLSFGVTLSLLLFVHPIQKKMSKMPIAWLRNSVSVVLAAWIGSIPLTAWHFYTVTPISPIFNLIFVPLVSATVPLLLVALLFTTLCPFGTILWFLPVKLLLYCLQNGTVWLYNMTENFFGTVQWNIGKPHYIVLMLYFVFLLLLWYLLHNKDCDKNRDIVSFMGILFLFIVCFSIPTVPNADELLYLDTGQGSCALLRTKAGEVVLFDAGAQKQELSSVLAWYGINNIDAVILSHSDTDHINGLPQVLRTVRIEQIFMEYTQMQREPIQDLIAQARNKNIHFQSIDTKSILSLENHRIDLQSFHDYTNSSNGSELTAVLHYANGTVVFPGDLSIPIVQKFVALLDEITIWTVPHHGSRFSGDTSLYQMLKKKGVQYAVISSGRNNHYGHPHQEVLEWINMCGIRLYSTAKQGAILFVLQ